MGLWALANHAVNFLAPAFWLALLLPLVARVTVKKRPVVASLLGQAALNFAVGGATLVLGLVLLGSDGKMLTYLALVLLCATSQWLMLRR